MLGRHRLPCARKTQAPLCSCSLFLDSKYVTLLSLYSSSARRLVSYGADELEESSSSEEEEESPDKHGSFVVEVTLSC